MAAEAWKGRFLERVVEADDRCLQILQTLAVARGHIETPVLTANAVEGRYRIQLALVAAWEASDDLDFFMCAAGEVTALALRGGALDPSVPLTSLQQLRVGNLGHRHAVEKLLEAMEPAEAAYGIMKLFDVHLQVMGLLLDRPGLAPDVDELIEEERLGAMVILRDHMLGLAQDCALLTGGARADVAGGN